MKNLAQTSLMAYEDIKKGLGKRQEICFRGLVELGGKATANELALYLYIEGHFQDFSRNKVHPRLVELEKLGRIKKGAREKDNITNKKCTVYEVIDNRLVTNDDSLRKILRDMDFKRTSLKHGYKHCLSALHVLGEATANEITQYLIEKKIINSFDRHYAHTNLYALAKKGKVEVVGIKIDSYSKKKCSIYKVIQ